MKTPPPKPWPKLSEDLPGERHPSICQACAASLYGSARQVWIECDESDTPTDTVVVLCQKCAGRIIEPHPRLYSQMAEHAPHPGTMPHLCHDCAHRRGLKCAHPSLKANGGEGLLIHHPAPFTAHITCSPRSKSGWYKVYSGPATGCAGREIVPAPKTDLFQ
jgi:hypothetical protein